MNRREIKNRIAFKIGSVVPCVEKYKIGAAVKISVTIRFISFRYDTFTRGQSNMRRFIYERSATNIRDWSLAYSFIHISRQSSETFLAFESGNIFWTHVIIKKTDNKLKYMQRSRRSCCRRDRYMCDTGSSEWGCEVRYKLLSCSRT